MARLISAVDVGYRRLLRPALFRIGDGDPEAAHDRMIAILGRVDARRIPSRQPSDPVRIAGIDFPNRIGLAAGLDKNGTAARAWAAFGFGHVELGTVTARPQPGNPQPRMFRLISSNAIINRMGFNNEGAAALVARLRRWGVSRGDATLRLPLGISIGKNKEVDLADATDNYLAALDAVEPFADYIAINISSPNTPGLRQLADRSFLVDLVTELVRRTVQLSPHNPVPVFVKLSPDHADAAVDEALEVCSAAGVSGIIATNTTLQRDHVSTADAALASQNGGLSGAPLTRRSREVVRHITAHTDLPVIGVGGVMTPDDASAMFDAGASLVQLYTGFIYRGPALIHQIGAATARTHDAHPPE